MPLYAYSAKNAAGHVVKGEVVAENETALDQQLRVKNLTLTQAKPASERPGDLSRLFDRLSGVPVVQKIFFTQNLEVMLRGGFSIGRALSTLALQTNHKMFRRVILTIQNDVEGGLNFSASLRKHPRVFSDMFVNMVAAGEVSGKLDEVLKHLTTQMKKDYQLISKIRGAMTYPIVVVIAMIGAAVAMLTFVIPKLLTVFNENQAELPLPTRILIAVSDFFQHDALWLGLGLVGLIAALAWFGRTDRGRRVYDSLFLVTPILGPIMKKINLARFTRSLSSMLATDIPIIQTFHIISRTLGSYHYRRSVDQAAEALRTGTSIAKILEQYPRLYPPIIQQMVSVGEESGTLDEVSADLALFYEEEVDQTMSNLSTIIEPVLLLVLGAGVAGMAVAILLPIYSLSEQIS